VFGIVLLTSAGQQSGWKQGDDTDGRFLANGMGIKRCEKRRTLPVTHQSASLDPITQSLQPHIIPSAHSPHLTRRTKLTPRYQ